LTKTDAHDEIKDMPLILVSDVTHYFSGNTMSYVEFSQGMIRNKTLLTDIYDPIFNKRVFDFYNANKHLNFEEMCCLMVDVLEKISMSTDTSVNKTLGEKVLTSINSKNSSIYVYDPSSVDDNMNNYYSNVFKLIKVQTNNCILGNTIDAEQSNSINNTIGLNKCKVNEIFNIFNLNYSMNQNLIKSQIKP
jgi:hypothetical protein